MRDTPPTPPSREAVEAARRLWNVADVPCAACTHDAVGTFDEPRYDREMEECIVEYARALDAFASQAREAVWREASLMCANSGLSCTAHAFAFKANEEESRRE